jgi:hypothetical protein
MNLNLWSIGADNKFRDWCHHNYIYIYIYDSFHFMFLNCYVELKLTNLFIYLPKKGLRYLEK